MSEKLIQRHLDDLLTGFTCVDLRGIKALERIVALELDALGILQAIAWRPTRTWRIPQARQLMPVETATPLRDGGFSGAKLSRHLRVGKAVSQPKNQADPEDVPRGYRRRAALAFQLRPLFRRQDEGNTCPWHTSSMTCANFCLHVLAPEYLAQHLGSIADRLLPVPREGRAMHGH